MIAAAPLEPQPGLRPRRRAALHAGTGLAALVLAAATLTSGPAAAQQNDAAESERLRRIEQELEADRNRAKALAYRALRKAVLTQGAE